MMEDEEALQEYLRRLRERSKYGAASHSDFDEEVTEVEQQALLPSVKDPKLWMVKCAVG
jgi:transcription elongation factor SPT5